MERPGRFSSEHLISVAAVAIIAVISLVLMISYTSPELSWDEGDYSPSAAKPWFELWSQQNYTRHAHGPMGIYLAKLGDAVLPSGWAVETRLRFFSALVGSLGVGLVYPALRYCFQTSRAAALTASALLLFSVTRIQETNIFGPHDAVLTACLVLMALGYRWRDSPRPRTAAALGVTLGVGLISMSYALVACLAWVVSVAFAGRGWIEWDRTHLKISWQVALMLAVGLGVAMALWPPSVLHHTIYSDFKFLAKWAYQTTLVGDRIYEITPRSAVLYWLAHLEAPLLVAGGCVFVAALWRALRRGGFSAKQVYVGAWIGVFLAALLTAHIAGARNMLQLLGVLCVAAGALMDEALGEHRRLAPLLAAAVVVMAAVNFVWHARDASYKPYLATDGYSEFVKQNAGRLREKAGAQVYGSPVLDFYLQQNGVSSAWSEDEMDWTTRADASLPSTVRYVLIPGFVWEYMPPDQPMRRVVADHWKVVWAYKSRRAWDLRLYERPAGSATSE